MSLRRGPVRRVGGGYVVDLGADETTIVRRLIGELREMLSDPDEDADTSDLLARLFPVAYPDDDEMEAEYQRLMRDELVQSKLAAFDVVDDALTTDAPIDEGQLIAVMQSINTIRLVLGVMLDVSDDPDDPEVADGFEDSPEYALYGYLSLLLERIVNVLDPTA